MADPVQTPKHAQLLAEEFGLRGRVQPYLESYIVPVVQVADLSSAAGVPARRIVTCTWEIPAAVGVYPAFQMYAGPGIIARLGHMIAFSAGAPVNIKLHLGNALASPGAAATVRFADTRFNVPDFHNPGIIPLVGNLAAGLGGTFEAQYRIPTANTPGDIDLSHIVLGSNDRTSNAFLEMSLTSANVEWKGTLVWEEFTKG